MLPTLLAQQRCANRVLGSVIHGDSNIFLNEHCPILRAAPGFDAAIHRPQGGCLLSGDRGPHLRDDVSETHKLACAGTSDGGSLFKGRVLGNAVTVTTSSDLVSAPSGWITTITFNYQGSRSQPRSGGESRNQTTFLHGSPIGTTGSLG